MEHTSYAWWQKGIIYQVYPRSFQDTNNDGIGDLKGVISRLDYLKWLGIDIVWISPVYPSPMKDFGYDISDYVAIHPMFGNMQDFDQLVEEVHKRNMKIILDLVPNHTSDKHPWFLESRSSRDNPKRDWYIWKDPTSDGHVPNNWLAAFGGSAWEWDAKTHQYYYHAFLKEQPDLNYRNPEVLNAMENVMRFWLDKKVDGFRVDVMWHMIKDKEFRNNPPNPNYLPHMPDCDSLLPVFSTDQPEVHDVVFHMRKVMEEYKDKLMIGEVYLPIDRLVSYYGINNEGAQLPFNFLLVLTQWDATHLASAIDQYIAELPVKAWPNWVLGNHDQKRIRSRVGLGQARVAGMLLLTLPGTPTIYYGDEIGMQDVPIPQDEVRDPQGLNMPGKNLSRDPARTPMQWDATDNAGFSAAKPWLRIGRQYETENVATEKDESDSMLLFYKRLITLRQKEPSLMTGGYERICGERQGIVYLRRQEGYDTFMIALNFTHATCQFTFNKKYNGKIELSTMKDLEGTEIEGTIYLSGDEGIIVRLENTNDEQASSSTI